MMVKTQKVTRLKLNIDQNSNFILYGLVSADPDYKLSLSLNKKFGISLKNIQSLKLPGDEGIFSRYSDASDPDKVVYNLISNRSEKKHLINKLKNVDYLLQLQISEDDEADISRITAGLREVENVTAVFNIELEKIKDKNFHYLNQ